jgi:hypothetical protein
MQHKRSHTKNKTRRKKKENSHHDCVGGSFYPLFFPLLQHARDNTKRKQKKKNEKSQPMRSESGVVFLPSREIR